jgi:hypothetical protein
MDYVRPAHAAFPAALARAVAPDMAQLEADPPAPALMAPPNALLLDESIPAVPVAPVSAEDILPQGNGPGVPNYYEPPTSPPHQGWWFHHVDTGANVHVACYPSELVHRVPSAGSCGTAGSSSMHVVCEAGLWVLQGNPVDCPNLHLPRYYCPRLSWCQTLLLQSSCHGMRRL